MKNSTNSLSRHLVNGPARSVKTINMESKMDDAAFLLISIFQKAAECEGVEAPTPVKYLELYNSEIKTACRVLGYLKLLERDDGSTLGWKLTQDLLTVIAKRPGWKGKPTKKTASIEQDLVLELILDIILASEKSFDFLFVSRALEALGLIAENDDEGYIPSFLFLRFFEDAYRSAPLAQHRRTRRIARRETS